MAPVAAGLRSYLSLAMACAVITLTAFGSPLMQCMQHLHCSLKQSSTRTSEKLLASSIT